MFILATEEKPDPEYRGPGVEAEVRHWKKEAGGTVVPAFAWVARSFFGPVCPSGLTSKYGWHVSNPVSEAFASVSTPLL